MYHLDMVTVSVSAAREQLAQAVEQAGREAVVIERYGRAAAVMISPARYEELMDALEEVEDVAAFGEAMVEEGPNIPWEQVKADLGRQEPAIRSNCARRPCGRCARSTRRRGNESRAPSRCWPPILGPRVAPAQGSSTTACTSRGLPDQRHHRRPRTAIVVVTVGHRREVYDR